MKHLTKKAKILSKNDDGTYTLGFGCPNCDNGYLTLLYTPIDGAALNIGDLIDVKISHITMDANGLPIIALLSANTAEPDWMPDIVKEAETLEMVELATRVQSLRFDKKKFNHNQAVSWAKAHGFKSGDVEETENQFRLRQFPPDKCTTSGGMKQITDGVSAYVCPVTQSTQESATPPGKEVTPKTGKYTIKEAIGDPDFRPESAKKDRGKIDFTEKPKPKAKGEFVHLYKIEQIADGKEYLAISKEVFETDTLVNDTDFEKIIQEHPMHDFVLQHHWWGNAEQYEHFDLFINTAPMTHLVFQKNPLKETEFKAQQREPYSEDFHLKGEKGAEDIPPGAPGNPSQELPAKIERIDTGKIAIYSNEQYADSHWEVSMEFFGTKLEGRWSMTSTTPRIWTVLKETVKLSGEIPGDLGIHGDISGWKETKDGLLVEGTAISFGTWNGMYWSPDIIRAAPLADFNNLIIDVEHDRSKAVGAVVSNQLVGSDIKVQGLITDYETATKIKKGELQGFSIDAMISGDPIRRMVTQVKQFKRLTVCNNPACRVCFFGGRQCPI